MHRCLWRAVSLLVACNYFAFRTELFSEEYEHNHPENSGPSHQVSINLPSLNWETFDKDNAPKAINVTPWISLTLLGNLPGESLPCKVVPGAWQLIRDKSPPYDCIPAS